MYHLVSIGIKMEIQINWGNLGLSNHISECKFNSVKYVINNWINWKTKQNSSNVTAF